MTSQQLDLIEKQIGQLQKQKATLLENVKRGGLARLLMDEDKCKLLQKYFGGKALPVKEVTISCKLKLRFGPDLDGAGGYALDSSDWVCEKYDLSGLNGVIDDYGCDFIFDMINEFNDNVDIDEDEYYEISDNMRDLELDIKAKKALAKELNLDIKKFSF